MKTFDPMVFVPLLLVACCVLVWVMSKRAKPHSNADVPHKVATPEEKATMDGEGDEVFDIGPKVF